MSIFVIVICFSVSATIINVPDDYEIIQEGINASTDGDTVLVEDGQYFERINFYGKGILLTSVFLIDGDTLHIQNTIIDADTLIVGVADTGSVVCFVNGEDSTSIIQGFTLCNGIGTGIYGDYSRGGGIYCRESSPTINYNIINGNFASPKGGGIHCYESSPIITNNTISANTALLGGGVHFMRHSFPIVYKNIITANSATDKGGGIHIEGIDCSPTIAYNNINGNTANFSGGGIFIEGIDTHPRIIGNIIFNNSADCGGGIYCFDTNPTIINNVINGNIAYSFGGGLYCDLDSTPLITNTIFWSDTSLVDGNEIYIVDTSSPMILYCNIEGGWQGYGNINTDPLFRDPDNDDWHLMAVECGDSINSPCIDIGHPSILDSLLDCLWGLGTSLSDMGAYGGGTAINPRTINIPDDFPTIQHGITISVDGDTILVQPGVYVENLILNETNIVLGSLFLTTGDTSFISSTIIDGDSTLSVVAFLGCDSTTVLTGFTIRNGNGNTGGGISCFHSNPQIINNIICNNITSSPGGGIYCVHSNPTISYNTICSNVALSGSYGGGGIYSSECNLIISHNNIIENSSSFRGGGIYVYSGNPIISNNFINDNCAITGGGIFCYIESEPFISDNIISGNSVELSGGGIKCYDSNANITGNNIIGNSAPDGGGGIFCLYAEPLITGNIISENTATTGGGIECYRTDAIIENNSIIENTAINGAAIYSYRSTPAISYNSINNNIADSTAGGIWCTGDNPSLLRNIIFVNSASMGGGIYVTGSEYSCDLSIINNTIYGNFAALGGGLYCLDSSPTIINSIFWADSAANGFNEIYAIGNSPVITYCDIQDTLWPGQGNISSAPLFVDPNSEDFNLLVESPCIDAGDPNSPFDPDSTRADIGALYYDQLVDIDVIDILPTVFCLYQNYPNPFNASTTISFSLSEPQFVTLKIYDLLGREIQTLVDEQMQTGIHSVTFDASVLSSGMYFYKLCAGDYTETRKMVLLK